MPRRKNIKLPRRPNKKQTQAFYKYLDNIYLDPKSGGAFSSAVKILEEVKRRGYYKNVTLHKIEKYLQGKPVQSLYRQSITKFRKPRVRVNTINSQFEIDLMDVSRFASQNDKYFFILVAVDVLSKFAFVRPLRSKHGQPVAEALRTIIDQRRPEVVASDKGSEFKSHYVQSLLKDRGIRHFFTAAKAAIVERLIRSIRLRLARYMFHNRRERYIDDLQKIIDSYNKSYHRSIKMRPVDVNAGNAHVAFDNLYGYPKLAPKKRYKLKKNDNVRISEIKSGFFTREYFERWSREIFLVHDRFRMDNINMYRIRDCAGTVLKGSFYEQELTKVNVSRFPIEAILDEKVENGRVYQKVKYENYPEACADWVLKTSITKL